MYDKLTHFSCFLWKRHVLVSLIVMKDTPYAAEMFYPLPTSSTYRAWNTSATDVQTYAEIAVFTGFSILRSSVTLNKEAIVI